MSAENPLLIRLTERVQALLEDLRSLFQNVPEDDVHTMKSEVIAEDVFRRIERMTTALVEPQRRRVVLRSVWLADNWPLRFDTSQVCWALLASLRFRNIDKHESLERWPTNLTIAEVATALRTTKDPRAQHLADHLDNGLIGLRPDTEHVHFDDRLYTGTTTIKNIANETETHPLGNVATLDNDVFQATKQWPIIPCAQVLAAEKLALEQAYASNVRVPTVASTSMLAPRSPDYERYSLAKLDPFGDIFKTPGFDPSGHTFPLPGSDINYWRFEAPSGFKLSVPLKGDTDKITDPYAAAREVMTGWNGRVYMALFAQAALLEENGLGFFEVDAKSILFDLLGLQPQFETKNGRQYKRVTTQQNSRLNDAVKHLAGIRLCGFKDITIEKPEPLIYHYGDIRDDKYHRHLDNVYAHARLIWQLVTKRFVQVPKAILRLESDHTHVALGFATVFGKTYRTWLPEGSMSMPLEKLAIAIGEDTKARTRRYGRAYWPKLGEQITTILKAGDLGTIHFEGDHIGPKTIVTIEPHDHLATAYSTISKAAAKQVTYHDAVRQEADVRKLLPPKRKRRKV